MANEIKISEIVDQSAFDELEKLDKKLSETQQTYLNVVKSIGQGLSFKPVNLGELNQKTDEYKSNVEKLKTTISEMNRLNKEYKSAIDDVVSGTKKATDATKQEQVAHEQNASSIQKESQISKENAQVKQQEVIISKDLKSLIDQTLGTREENIQRLAEERTILSQLSKEKSSLNKLEKNGAITAADAVKERQKIISSELLHRNASRELLNVLTNETKTIISASDSYQEQSLQLERMRMAYRALSTEMANSPLGKDLQKNIDVLDKRLKGIDSNLGQYGRGVGNYKSQWDGLGNAINQLTREAPAFAVSLQTGFLAISNNIPILADQIQRIRNENAALRQEGLKTIPVWKQVLSSALSWQTALSVGITLLTVYGKDVIEWTSNLFKSTSAARGAEEAIKDLSSSSGDFSKELKNSTSNYGSNLVLLRSLQEEWNGLGGSIDKQKQFIIDNASEFKKLDVSIRDVHDAENLLVTNTDVFIEALRYRAKAAASEKLATEKYAEALQKRVEADNKRAKADEIIKKGEIANYQNLQDTRYGEIKSREQLSEQYANSTKLDAKNLDKEIKSLESAGNAYFDYAKKNTEAFRKTLKNAGIEERTNEERRKREEERLKREAEKRQKLEMEAERNIQNSKVALMEEGYEKDRKALDQSYQKRIDDVKTKGVRVNEQIKLIEEERSNALAKFDEKIAAERAMKEAENRLSIAEKGSLQELDARLDILELQRNQELKEAEKTGQDRALIEDKYNKLIEQQYTDFGKNQLKRMQSQDEIELTQRQEDLNKELVILEQQYAKGVIKKEAYEKKKADLQFKYSSEALQKELDTLEANLYLFSGDDRLEMEKKIAQLRLKLSKETTDKIISDAEREKKSREEVEKAKVKLIQDAANAIGDIGNSLFERQINNIDAEIDANETEYDEQVSRIDALAEKEIITKEEAEARKRAAEEATAAKNKELEKKKAELQTRQARFQKTIDIGQAIANTAIAVMKAWSQGGIFAAPLAAMIAAIGAIQLATIIAQPIPKYAKGTDNHPGGLAVVGDGGKHEAVIHNGKAFITPDTPTLMSLPKGVEVIPDIRSKEFYDRFMDNSYYLSHNDAGEPVKIVNNFDVRGLEKGNKEIQKEIRNLTKTIGRSRRGDSFEAYKRRQI